MGTRSKQARHGLDWKLVQPSFFLGRGYGVAGWVVNLNPPDVPMTAGRERGTSHRLIRAPRTPKRWLRITVHSGWYAQCLLGAQTSLASDTRTDKPQSSPIEADVRLGGSILRRSSNTRNPPRVPDADGPMAKKTRAVIRGCPGGAGGMAVPPPSSAWGTGSTGPAGPRRHVRGGHGRGERSRPRQNLDQRETWFSG